MPPKKKQKKNGLINAFAVRHDPIRGRGSVETSLIKFSFSREIQDDKFGVLDIVFKPNISTPNNSLACTSNKIHKFILLPVNHYENMPIEIY